MAKIAIGCPSPDKVPAEFVTNLLGILAYTKEHTDHEIHYVNKTGVRTDRNRNIILERAIEREMDYILWLDVDMLYPHDIIVKYMKCEFDVMGCLYFKRSDEFTPVGYVKGKKPGLFTPLDPRLLPKDSVLEVDGLGYGGMMVNMKLYNKMGEDKWTHYSPNFHLPYETDEPKITHDLVFCMDAQKHGAQILLHTGVRPGHLTETVITETEWLAAKVEPKAPNITVIMPTIHTDMARKTKDILSARAGMEAFYAVMEDPSRWGYVHACNNYIKLCEDSPADYYCYVTDDIFPSRNWLKDAYELLIKKDGKMVGFNDGKWKGSLATCGLVEAEWMRNNYEGNLFYPEYFGHYNDTELTLLAMQDNVYCYDANISLTEIDYEKDQKKAHEGDRKLYNERKAQGFNGRVTDQKLLDMFS